MTEHDHILEAAQDELFSDENWTDIPDYWYKLLKERGDINPSIDELWQAFDTAAKHEVENEENQHRQGSLKRQYDAGITWPSAVTNAHRLIVLKWIQQNKANTTCNQTVSHGSDGNTPNSPYSSLPFQTGPGFQEMDGCGRYSGDDLNAREP